MDSIREYLIGVIAAAVLCSIVTNLIDTKSMVGVTVKLVAGLLMLFAVIRPWAYISFQGLLGWTENIYADGSDFAHSGETMAQEAYRDGIIRQTQAYILEEAKALDCTLEVEVVLSNDDVPFPEQIRLKGELSPYAKQTLSTILTERLGIKREDQIWT